MNTPVVTKASELKDIIKINGKMGITTLIIGNIGIGKSEIVKSIYEEMKKECPNAIFEDIRTSYIDRTDLRGLFKIEGEVTKWYLSERINKFCKEDACGVLFFDEINLGEEDVMSSLYQIILDREIEGKKIGDGVIIVAACNDSSEVEIVKPISKALLNRMSVVKYAPNANENIEYLYEKYGNSNVLCNYVLSFMTANKELVKDDLGKEEMDQFARPRGWERVLKYITIYKGNSSDVKGKLLNDTDVTIISSYVGLKAANKLKAYIENIEMYDIDKMLKDSKGFSIDDVNQFALASVLGEWIYDRREDDNIIKKVKEKIMSKMNKESVLWTLKILKKKSDEGIKILEKHFVDVLKTITIEALN